jgi:F0F1-type ATP synthase beta subunit
VKQLELDTEGESNGEIEIPIGEKTVNEIVALMGEAILSVVKTRMEQENEQ